MSNNEGVDYAQLAKGLDDIREMLRAMVAAVMADGFTEEQARSIVAGFFAGLSHRERTDDH